MNLLDVLPEELVLLALLRADLLTLIALKPACRQLWQLARRTITCKWWLMNHAAELRHHCWRSAQHAAKPLECVHTGRVYALALGARFLVSGGDDGRLHAYDASTWEHLESRTLGRAVKPWEIAAFSHMTPPGDREEWFAVHGRKYTPSSSGPLQMATVQVFGPQGPPAATVSLVAYDPLEQTWVCIADRSRVIVVTPTAQGSFRRRTFLTLVRAPTALAVGGGQIVFTSGQRHRQVSVGSLEGGYCVQTPAACHGDTVYALAATVGRVVSGSDDRTVNLWLTYTAPPRPVCTIDTGAKVWALAIAASGDLLVSAGHGNSVGDIHLWDLSGVPRDDGDPHDGLFEAVHLASLRGPPCTRSLAFDGDRVVAGGNDGVVRVWQHPGSGLIGPLWRDHAFWS